MNVFSSVRNIMNDYLSAIDLIILRAIIRGDLRAIIAIREQISTRGLSNIPRYAILQRFARTHGSAPIVRAVREMCRLALIIAEIIIHNASEGSMDDQYISAIITRTRCLEECDSETFAAINAAVVLDDGTADEKTMLNGIDC